MGINQQSLPILKSGSPTPSLNEQRASSLKEQAPKNCRASYSNSRGGEIALLHNINMNYQMVINYMDKVTLIKAIN